MHKDKLISDKTKQYLIQTDVRPGRLYILTKVHKPGNPGRPIVSSNSHPTERISHFVDYHDEVDEVDEVVNLLDKCAFDILFISESKIDGSVSSTSFAHAEYRIIRKDRKKEAADY